MANAIDIKDLLCQSFHEIYDVPMEENDLDDLFKHQTKQNINLEELQYDTQEVPTLQNDLLMSLKHSFKCPFTFSNDFSYHNHVEGQAHSTINSTLPECNALFQRYGFLINFEEVIDQDDDNVWEGRKRKRPSKTTHSLPTSMIKSLLPPMQRQLCAFLSKLHTQEEQNEIFKWALSQKSSCFEAISQYKDYLIGHNTLTISKNFGILVELQQIASSANSVFESLSTKQYKTTRDNIELSFCQLILLLQAYLQRVCLENLEDPEAGSLLSHIIYYFYKCHNKLQLHGFEMILFLHEVKPWMNKIAGMADVYDDVTKFYENTEEASLFDLFFKKRDGTGMLKMNVPRTKAVMHKKFNSLCSESENEGLLFVDFSNQNTGAKFLDKFYMLEIQESRGIIMHDKINFEVLEEAEQRRLCIVPKDLNDRGIVCTMGSKLAVLNNSNFEKLADHE